MRKKIYLFTTVMAILCHPCFSQSYDNNWVFGDSAGLNFSSGEPEYFYSHIATLEACASISDSAGNLLFYTNGQKIWNYLNDAIGSGLDIGITGGGTTNSSITQGVIILPVPGAVKKYYVIYLSGRYFDSNLPSLEYTMVDMYLFGGHGAIVGDANTIVNNTDTLYEKMQAVRHANGRDWWLMTLTTPKDPAYYYSFAEYLITPNGIDGPYYQNGSINDGNSAGSSQGQMKFSKDGTKLILTWGRYLDIYDFDRCTGLLNNSYTIKNVPSGEYEANNLYGAEISANKRNIYVSTWCETGHSTSIYQFSLTAPDIADSKTIIYICDKNYSLYQMQLATDNKIYIIKRDLQPPFNTNVNTTLSLINNPDGDSMSCDFDTSIISLGKEESMYGLPNMPNYALGPLIGSGCDTLTVINNYPANNTISIYPNPSSGYFIISGNEIENDLTVELYDMTGEKIITRQQVKLNVPVYVNDMNNGVYEVILKKNDQILYSGKLVVMK